LEVLAFNMVHWLCSSLPWEQVIAMDKKGKEKTVEEMKIKFMDNITEGLNSLKFPPTEKGRKIYQTGLFNINSCLFSILKEILGEGQFYGPP